MKKVKLNGYKKCYECEKQLNPDDICYVWSLGKRRTKHYIFRCVKCTEEKNGEI